MENLLFRFALALTATASSITPIAVGATVPTGITGNSLPHSNVQPTLAIDYLVALTGAFPSQSTPAGGEAQLGEIIPFAGSFAPKGFAFASGQTLTINGNSALFSVLSTTYGGSSGTFQLPNLAGRAAVGAGQGTGLSSYSLGQKTGSLTSTLTEAQMPVHVHSLPGGGTTAPEGGGQAIDIRQPTLATNYFFQSTGYLPVASNGVATNGFVGQVRQTAAIFSPGGDDANGRTLTVASNPTLFTQYAVTYGGNGVQTFAVPDLRGRSPMGTGTGTGLTPRFLGGNVGIEQVTLAIANLPAHSHTLPAEAGGGSTGSVGSNLAYNNIAPSLGLNYLIATTGNYPDPNSGNVSSTALLGELTLTGGTVAPDGWAFCNGQLLSIFDNSDLFSVIGTTYGGDGQSTFALPDLRSRIAVGAGTNFPLGSVSGNESNTLTIGQLASHDHDVSVPEPDTLAVLSGIGSTLLSRRRRVR